MLPGAAGNRGNQVTCSFATWAGMMDLLQHEKWKYYQNTSKEHVKVHQNLTVCSGMMRAMALERTAVIRSMLLTCSFARASTMLLLQHDIYASFTSTCCD